MWCRGKKPAIKMHRKGEEIEEEHKKEEEQEVECEENVLWKVKEDKRCK